MKRLNDVLAEQQSMSSVVGLTDVFEGLASMRIAQVKDQVLSSQHFFNELWSIYSQIRVNKQFSYGRGYVAPEIDKELLIAVTAEGGLSGDIDQKLISWMLSSYDKDKQDIIIIGHHGALQLAAAGVPYKRYFKLPIHDDNINVSPLIGLVRMYSSTVVYYQSYVTLMVQDIKKIELKQAIEEASKKAAHSGKVISDENYIFEPSTTDVASHLENTMMLITLTQTILDSKLAQYASRFRSMKNASEKADDMMRDLKREYNRTRRFIADERLKEVINGLGKIGAQS
jgi:F-type H+-transporting ATPase subunit gamma